MSKIYPSKDVAENKLLILYILGRLKTAVKSVELTDYILGERLMEYIDLQQHIHELAEDSLIGAASDGGYTMYAIAEDGKAVLADMSDMLPMTEKNRVNRTIGRLIRGIINARSVAADNVTEAGARGVAADYTPEDENRSVVRVELNEAGTPLMALEVAVASKEEARRMCANWKSNAAEIYAGIVGLLLNPPPPG